jgi:hypothetical protein
LDSNFAKGANMTKNSPHENSKFDADLKSVEKVAKRA